jgi:hypothetical protein
MAEQITSLEDEGEQPEHEVSAQPSGETGLEPSGWAPPGGDVTPGMLGPGGDPAGAPEQAAASSQLGGPADVAGLEADAAGERSRRRKVILISAAAAVLIAGGIGVGVALRGGGGPPFPASVLGLTRNTNSDAQQAAGQVTSALGMLQGLIVHPAAAIYGPGPKGVLILTGQWSDSAKADGLITASPGP